MTHFKLHKTDQYKSEWEKTARPFEAAALNVPVINSTKGLWDLDNKRKQNARLNDQRIYNRMSQKL
jgi:hypothetical protein